MEEHNGRTVEKDNQLSIEQLMQENTELKRVINKLIESNENLKQAWALKRLDFLFRIVDSKEFNSDFKMKAVEEIESFLYPKQEKLDNVEQEINDNHE